MKLFLPRFYARVHMDLRLQSRSYNMRPDRKRTAQVSYQTLPSVLWILTAFSLISYGTLTTALQHSEAVLPGSFKYATLAAFKYGRKFPRHASDISAIMRLWMKAASALPYTDDVGGSVVVGLLKMASIDQSLSHIPTVAWDWLNKRPVLTPECAALLPGSTKRVIQTIQRLGGVRLIASYLCLIWSEDHEICYSNTSAMHRLIREELGGIGAVGYRTDLIRRVDHVLLQLDRSSQGDWRTKEKYEKFRRELLEVDEKATKILTGTSSSHHPFFVY